MAVRFRCLQSKWADKQLTEVPSITLCAPFENIVSAARFERWRSTRTDPVSVAIRSATRFSMNYMVKNQGLIIAAMAGITGKPEVKHGPTS